MRTPKDKSGFAFPLAVGENQGYSNGMTLRDYFAGQALAGLASRGTNFEIGWVEYAEMAYLAADAMLDERVR
jgi:hypothetical protein